MARERHLPNAPAREALVDIQFEPRVQLEVIDRFVDQAKEAYPRRSDLLEALFGFGTAAMPRASQAIVGRRLDAAPGAAPYVMQCKLNSFTLSRLSPYGRWEELRSEASHWWDVFEKLTDPKVISRIAVRYINAIKLPLPVDDFQEYFTCPPQIPASLPNAMSGFLQRVVIPDHENDCVSIVTQALEDSPTMGPEGATVTVLLDIDVFRDTRLDIKDSRRIWEGLEALRRQKNRMFFEHLTERTVEMFE